MRPCSKICQHRRRVIIGVDPVAHITTLAVQLRANTPQDVGDLAWNELLDVLVWAVVVGAIRNRRCNAKRPDPRSHQQVAAGLRRGVRRGRVVRGGFGEPAGSSSAKSPYTSSVEIW